MKKTCSAIMLFALIGILSFTMPVLAVPGDTTRASVNSSGVQGNMDSDNPSVSADGRYVAFDSSASNLFSPDPLGGEDIFIRDTQTGITTIASLGPLGTQVDGASYDPSISADGRYVAFTSNATNLVPGDTNSARDIFLRDIIGGTTTRVSVHSSGTQGNSISESPTISPDGRYVAFTSTATNLVSGDFNNEYDVFLRDTIGGITTRISVDPIGADSNGRSHYPSVSTNGRFVAFSSDANNLVAGDTNGVPDVFIHDTQTGSTSRVSVDSSGAQGNGGSVYSSISSDGRFVAFSSSASNLVSGDTDGQTNVFVHDTQTGNTTLVSVDSSGQKGYGGEPTISADGRYVAFESPANNLVAGDTNLGWDIFVHDTTTGVTIRASVSSNGTQANDSSERPSISGNGRFVVFNSEATNLVAGDSNGDLDIFVNEINFTAPALEYDTHSIPPTDGAILVVGPSQLVVSFNQDVLADASQHAANSLQNYMLLRPGGNNTFDTGSTSAAICDAAHTPSVDDVLIPLNSIAYDNVNMTATLIINPAFAPLAGSSYRLYVCGESSIWNSRSVPLNSGANSAINFTVNGGGGTGGTGSSAASSIPATGFAPGRVTRLPRQSDPYTDQGSLSLEIPSLGVSMSVTGVPRHGSSWDVTWLGEEAGWLEGTAFPSWNGNSVVTGHVWNADNTPGPFRHLDILQWGDRIIIHYAGQHYIYEVRGVEQVKPGDVRTMIRHEESPWLTLVTCKGFDEKTESYRERLLVRAALIDVK